MGWWKGEGNANDLINGNHGAANGVAYPLGKVGQAFDLDGNNSILVPASSNLNVQSFTIETWINPSNVSAPLPLVEFATATSSAGVHLWIGSGSAVTVPGAIYANIRDINGGSHSFGTGSGVVATGQWQHVTLSYNRTTGMGLLYKNSSIVAQASLGTNFVPATAYPLNIGYRPSGSQDGTSGARYVGGIDELAIYNRALSSNEIAAVYQAGAAGKCFQGIYFTVGGLLPNAILGDSYTQTLTASGAAPFSYTLVSNALPAGLTLSASGVISGIPQTVGTFSFAIQVADAQQQIAEQQFSLQVDGCSSPASGMVAWWRGEDNAGDSVGGNHGVASAGVSFSPGKVGTSFNMNGTDGYVIVPASSNLTVQSFTIEGWINPTDGLTKRPVIDYCAASGKTGVHLWINERPNGGLGSVAGTLAANVRDINDGDHQIITSGGLILPNQWQHVAVTYDKPSGVAQLLIGGNLVTTKILGSFTPKTALPVNLGQRPSGSSESFGFPPFVGQMDEMSIYNRVLTTNEIAAIAVSGSAGKCLSVAADIVQQPQSQTVILGNNLNLFVSAVGSGELSYQWFFNETIMTGATNASLIISVRRST
ncbi:MAG: putative Ig domain-containing protein [Verrucomicrobia bacterium]|nr:putative Ig domain-containing protein [Verrucomicrobiota bacterium]